MSFDKSRIYVTMQGKVGQQNTMGLAVIDTVTLEEHYVTLPGGKQQENCASETSFLPLREAPLSAQPKKSCSAAYDSKLAAPYEIVTTRHLPDDYEYQLKLAQQKGLVPVGASKQEISNALSIEFAYVSSRSEPGIWRINIDPSSKEFHVVDLITLGGKNGVPFGVRGLAANHDGTRLYVAAPEIENFMGSGWRGEPAGSVLVIGIDPSDKKTWWSEKYFDADGKMHFQSKNAFFGKEFDAFEGDEIGRYPWGVAALPEKLSDELNADVLVANFLSGTSERPGPDNLQFLDDAGPVENGIRFSLDPTGEELANQKSLGRLIDQFNTSNPRNIAIHPEQPFAFVTSHNLPELCSRYNSLFEVSISQGCLPFQNHFFPESDPAGSNIAVVDLRTGTVLAGTDGIPGGFPQDISISDDGTLLFVSYPGVPIEGGGRGAIYVYNATEMIKHSTTLPREKLQKQPLDELVPSILLSKYGVGGNVRGVLGQSPGIVFNLGHRIQVDMSQFELDSDDTFRPRLIINSLGYDYLDPGSTETLTKILHELSGKEALGIPVINPALFVTELLVDLVSSALSSQSVDINGNELFVVDEEYADAVRKALFEETITLDAFVQLNAVDLGLKVGASYDEQTKTITFFLPQISARAIGFKVGATITSSSEVQDATTRLVLNALGLLPRSGSIKFEKSVSLYGGGNDINLNLPNWAKFASEIGIKLNESESTIIDSLLAEGGITTPALRPQLTST